VREQARLDAEERREERRLSLRMLAAAEAAGHAAITALFRGRRIHRSPDRCRTQASGQDILKNPEVAVLNPECRAPSVKGVPRQLQKTPSSRCTGSRTLRLGRADPGCLDPFTGPDGRGQWHAGGTNRSVWSEGAASMIGRDGRDLLGWVVGLPGLEPGTSSLSDLPACRFGGRSAGGPS
jgi:hypothetical protein